MGITILDKIILNKRMEVERQKEIISFESLLSLERKRNWFSLKAHLLKEGSSGVIAEFKRRSPSKGWINKDAVAGQIIPGYENAGAGAVSILTDEVFFGGGLTDIAEAGGLVTLPILRKDFILDEYQVVEAAKIGADAILLIAANLSAERVEQLAKTAKQNELEVLLEIHDRKELDHICPEIDLVGVNNRDLHTFKTDLRKSLDLGSLIPERFVKISESGINHPDDIRRLRDHGFKGFLIGERFMKTTNPAKACREFIAALDLEGTL